MQAADAEADNEEMHDDNEDIADEDEAAAAAADAELEHETDEDDWYINYCYLYFTTTDRVLPIENLLSMLQGWKIRGSFDK